MNKLFITFFTWIFLQFSNFNQWLVSLFKRGKENSNESTNHTDLKDPEENPFLDTETPIINYTNEESSLLDENNTVEPEILLIETEVQQNQLTEYSLYDGKYDTLFDTPEVPVPEAIVHREIWDLIYEKLPQGYTIPATSSKNLYTNKQTYYV